MEHKTFTRKELYDLVWTEPLIKLASIYHISDNGLRKICIRMNIPLPRAGHWQKLLFGKRIFKPALNEKYSGVDTVTLDLRTESEMLSRSEISPIKKLQNEIEYNLNQYLQVPEKLTKPDKLVIAARESIAKNKWHQSNGVISCWRGELHIRAAKSNIPRVLRFVDTLIKLLRARGHEVGVDDNSTYALVKNQKFDISLREKTKRVQRQDHPTLYDYEPTGLLVFKTDRIFHTKEWIDGKNKLEDQLSSILATLEIASDQLNAEQIIRNKEREERERQETLRKELEKRQEQELAVFKQILQKATRWHKAVNLRNYINEVEQNATSSNQVSQELSTWLEWARKKADWYDPFTDSPDELFQNIDKETLTVPQKHTHSLW
jgi:hypothetical protein